MMPSSWKTEIEETVEKAAHSSSERQRVQDEKNSADISAAIKSLTDAYNAQRDKPERKDQIKRFLDVANFFLLVGTVVFTGLSWWVFRDQLVEMKRAYGPVKDSAAAAKKSADVAESALLNLERPYIFVEDAKVIRPPSENPRPWDPTEIEFKFKNYGRTPATVTWWRAFIVVDDTKPTSTFEGWNEGFNGQIILNKDDSRIAEPSFKPSIPFPRKGGDGVILKIEVTYWDVFDYAHVNEFTYLYQLSRTEPNGVLIAIPGPEDNRHKDKKFEPPEKWTPMWSHAWPAASTR